MMSQETWPIGTKTVDAVKRFPKREEPSEAAFTLINKPGESIFAHLAQHPDRARRFGGAMRYYGRFESWNLKHLVHGYPWSQVDRPGAIFVDVGGGQGSVPQALVGSTKSIRFIVQDLKSTVEDGRDLISEQLKRRIEFMQHDFFTEQP